MKKKALLKIVSLIIAVCFVPLSIPVKAAEFTVSASAYALINADTMEILA